MEIKKRPFSNRKSRMTSGLEEEERRLNRP
jgi:hypothetical protein